MKCATETYLLMKEQINTDISMIFEWHSKHWNVVNLIISYVFYIIPWNSIPIPYFWTFMAKTLNQRKFFTCNSKLFRAVCHSIQVSIYFGEQNPQILHIYHVSFQFWIFLWPENTARAFTFLISHVCIGQFHRPLCNICHFPKFFKTSFLFLNHTMARYIFLSK